MTTRCDQSDHCRRTGRSGPLWAFLGSGLLALTAQWPGLVNPLVVNDDVRQQLFWMRRWIDPALYPPDILGDYSRCYVTWGVQALYRLGALAVDPLLFSKFVAITLLALLGTLVFLCARKLQDEALAWLCVAGFWLMPAFLENISGGLARAFAAPLLALFLYAQLAHSRPAALLALWVQALFIPYILPICLGAAVLHFAVWKLRLVRTEPLLRRVADLLGAAGALGLALLWQSGMDKAGFGPLPWAADMTGRPEFGLQGRFAILPTPSMLWELFARPWSVLTPFQDQGTAAGVVCTLVLLPLLATGARRLDWRALKPQAAAIGSLLLASLLLFFAAKTLLLKLFIPSRYLEYTTNLFYCLGVPLLLSPLVLPTLRRWSKPAIMALLAAMFVLGAARQHGRELFDYSQERPLYEAAHATPPDTLFAGFPTQMDNVLTFGQRNVYASFELAHPWSTGYWKVIGPRLSRMLHAYYTSDPDEIRRFCAQERIDILVVDRRHFTPEFMGGRPLFEPYGTEIRQRLQDPAPFALLASTFPRIEIDDNISLVDMRGVTRPESAVPQ
jgi:hypothetical protein